MSTYDHAYYSRPIAENWFARYDLLRPDQLAAICYAFGQPFWGDEPCSPRDPGLVLSIGCGRGDLEAQLEYMDVQVIGTDTSSAAAEIYRGGNFLPLSCLNAIRQNIPDTVIFCESIEHIPDYQTLTALDLLRDRPHPTRVIVVNWPDRHPIYPDATGWDHVTEVDDVFFNQLSAKGKLIFRRGSHLVIDIGGDT